jgi:hypothetical protein
VTQQRIPTGRDILKMAIFNPMSCGTPEQILSTLAASADLILTSEQEEAALAIIRSLPRDATIRDFVDACDRHAASQLRVSRETLDAVKPLLAVFESTTFRGSSRIS